MNVYICPPVLSLITQVPISELSVFPLGAVGCCAACAVPPPSLANVGAFVRSYVVGFDDSRMPWVVGHLDANAIWALDYGDIRITDEFRMALDHMEYMAEKLDGTGVLVYPPDLQGPFDIAHIVFGDEIFYAMYDDPKLVHHLLDLCVCAIKLGMDESLKVIPRSDELLAHYSSLVMPRSLGGIKLSEDTTTLINAEQMDEFAVPYTAKILDYFGGGYIHYCGKNDLLFERITGLDKAHGLNFGNPEKHDMDNALRNMAERGLCYYGWMPMPENEDYEAYFRRVIGSATVGGRRRLLLELNVPYSERGRVSEVWEDVTEKYQENDEY